MSIDISIVIPVYDEEQNLSQLHQELTQVLSGYGRTYELIFVDDGSLDGSFELLANIQLTDPHVRLIRFRKNFGQTFRTVLLQLHYQSAGHQPQIAS